MEGGGGGVVTQSLILSLKGRYSCQVEPFFVVEQVNANKIWGFARFPIQFCYFYFIDDLYGEYTNLDCWLFRQI